MKRWLAAIPGPERTVVMTSVIVSLGLLAIKFIAYYLTGSAAIFSDAIESIVNVIASLFAVYSLVLAHQPADAQHPYGHGKVEFMSAGFEGGMILLAAFLIVVRGNAGAGAGAADHVVGDRLDFDGGRGRGERRGWDASGLGAGKRGFGDFDRRWKASAQRCRDERGGGHCALAVKLTGWRIF